MNQLIENQRNELDSKENEDSIPSHLDHLDHEQYDTIPHSITEETEILLGNVYPSSLEHENKIDSLNSNIHPDLENLQKRQMDELFSNSNDNPSDSENNNNQIIEIDDSHPEIQQLLANQQDERKKVLDNQIDAMEKLKEKRKRLQWPPVGDNFDISNDKEVKKMSKKQEDDLILLDKKQEQEKADLIEKLIAIKLNPSIENKESEESNLDLIESKNNDDSQNIDKNDNDINVKDTNIDDKADKDADDETFEAKSNVALSASSLPGSITESRPISLSTKKIEDKENFPLSDDDVKAIRDAKRKAGVAALMSYQKNFVDSEFSTDDEDDKNIIPLSSTESKSDLDISQNIEIISPSNTTILSDDDDQQNNSIIEAIKELQLVHQADLTDLQKKHSDDLAALQATQIEEITRIQENGNLSPEIEEEIITRQDEELSTLNDEHEKEFNLLRAQQNNEIQELLNNLKSDEQDWAEVCII